jgi:hypothetical protein
VAVIGRIRRALQCAAYLPIVGYPFRSRAGLVDLVARHRSWLSTPGPEPGRGGTGKRKPDCARGCSHCCYQGTVQVTAPEVMAVSEFIRRTRDPASLAALRARIRTRREAVEGLSGPAIGSRLDPCVLLEDGLCSVYPVRPLLCAGLLSFDVEACREALGSGSPVTIDRVPIHRRNWTRAVRVQEAVLCALRVRGLPADRYELTGALDVALGPAHDGNWPTRSELAPTRFRPL